MGYELHITRAREWSMSSNAPIPREQWDAVCSASAALELAGSVTFGGEVFEVFELAGEGASGASLHWYEGRVDVSGASDEHVPALVDLAMQLDAQVLGDDGERYPIQVGTDGASTYSANDLRRMRQKSYRLIADGSGGLRKARVCCRFG